MPNILTIILLYALGMFVLIYVFTIIPGKKKNKQVRAMHDAVKPGDEIVTIGGIVGKIVMVKPDTIVIETSDDRVRMELTKWAVSTTGVQSSGEEKKEDEVKKTEEIPEAPAEETDASSEEEKKD